MVKARNSLFEAGKEGGEYREKGFCLTQTRKEIIMCEVKSLDFIKKASDKVEKEKQKADGKAAWKKGMERARKHRITS